MSLPKHSVLYSLGDIPIWYAAFKEENYLVWGVWVVVQICQFGVCALRPGLCKIYSIAIHKCYILLMAQEEIRFFNFLNEIRKGTHAVIIKWI